MYHFQHAVENMARPAIRMWTEPINSAFRESELARQVKPERRARDRKGTENPVGLQLLEGRIGDYVDRREVIRFKPQRAFQSGRVGYSGDSTLKAHVDNGPQDITDASEDELSSESEATEEVRSQLDFIKLADSTGRSEDSESSCCSLANKQHTRQGNKFGGVRITNSISHVSKGQRYFAKNWKNEPKIAIPVRQQGRPITAKVQETADSKDKEEPQKPLKISDDEQELLSSCIFEFGKKFPQIQCPFTWNIKPILSASEMIAKRVQCVEELENSKTEEMEDLIDKLIFCLEHVRMEDYSNASVHLAATESIVRAAFFEPYKRGVRHVLRGCEIAIEFAKGKNVIPPTDYACLSAQDKSFVCALRGLMLRSYKNASSATEDLREALNLDPINPYWHYSLGKVLGSIRRRYNRYSKPSEEEMRSLLFAVENSKIAGAFIHLAEANRAAYCATKDRFYAAMANTLYKNAVKLNSNCPLLNIRCARGLSTLPAPYRDVAVAEECTQMALEKAPNNALVTHYAGLFYQHGVRNIYKAQIHFEKATSLGNFPAHMSLLSLLFKQRHKDVVDVEQELTKMLSQYKETIEKVQILCQRGYHKFSYFHDMAAAIRDWIEAMEMTPESTIFRKIRPPGAQTPINLLDLMKEEIEKALRRTFKMSSRQQLNHALDLVRKMEEQNAE